MEDKVFYMLVTRGDEGEIIILNDHSQHLEDKLKSAGWTVEIMGRTEVGSADQYIYLYE
jgi:hypothetical protein